MLKLLPAALFALFPALAAAADDAMSAPPSEPVHVFYVIVFAVIFFGMIAGFFIYMFINERKNKEE